MIIYGILFVVTFVEGIHIVWDKNAPTEYAENEFTRSDQIRIGNFLLIYPGTKWCGAGNIADGDDDFGDFWKTDKCCRNHDFCSDIIEGYQSSYGLTNDQFYTKLNCECDQTFYECLKSVNTFDSRAVGTIYFNALGSQCFKNDFPIKKCNKFIYFPRKKCMRYELDETMEKLYQWFDVPVF